PGVIDVLCTLNEVLPFAVIAHPPSLEYAVDAQLGGGAHEVLLAVDGGMRGRRNPQSAEQCLFLEPILRHFQRRARRANDRQFLERRESTACDVFPIEREDIA